MSRIERGSCVTPTPGCAWVDDAVVLNGPGVVHTAAMGETLDLNDTEVGAALTVRSRAGERLAGKYDLLKLLGAGGMGEVYRAENVLIGRIVAIKVLHPHLANEPEVVARFLQEGRAANLLRHPNAVDILDVGQDDRGTPFIVEEFFEGKDLGQAIDQAGGKLPWQETLELLLPVVDALAAAHARGIVHRDVKPENVFLAEEGGRVVPKLLDFGISLLSHSTSPRLTAPGTALGTPAYMAPEQVLGANLDVRVDVWALGVLFYEVLSGVLPFESDTPNGFIIQIATGKPRPLSEVAPQVHPELAEVIMRCLERAPEARYGDAARLGRALRMARLSMDSETEAPPTPVLPERRLTAASFDLDLPVPEPPKPQAPKPARRVDVTAGIELETVAPMIVRAPWRPLAAPASIHPERPVVRGLGFAVFAVAGFGLLKWTRGQFLQEHLLAPYVRGVAGWMLLASTVVSAVLALGALLRGRRMWRDGEWTGGVIAMLVAWFFGMVAFEVGAIGGVSGLLGLS